MKEFVFEQKQKNFFIALIVIGLVSMIWTFFHDDVEHTRFWTNFLHDSVFFTGITFIATFTIAAFTTAYTGWYLVFKRVWEAYSLFLIVALGFMIVLVLGVWLHWNHLYEWSYPEIVAKDKVLSGKKGFLNPVWYTFSTIGFIGVWYYFALKFRKLSIDEDQIVSRESYPFYKQSKFWSAVFLPIAAFSSAAAIWQWLMSVDARWYSTMYAWQATASWFESMIALTILMLMYFKSKGYFEAVTVEHFHDLGKYLFAFSIFWTYLWFSQYMLIWYANVGEETIYFRQRMGDFPLLFYGNLVLNFVLPFLILIRNDTKRKYGSLGFIAVIVLFGQWIHFFQMVKIGPYFRSQERMGFIEHPKGQEGVKEVGKEPAKLSGRETTTEGAQIKVAEATVAPNVMEPENYFHYGPVSRVGFSFPGFEEFGTLCFFAGIFLFFVFNQLTKTKIMAEGDPFMNESLNHHVELHGDDAH